MLFVASWWTTAAAADVDLAAGVGALRGQCGFSTTLSAEVGAYGPPPTESRRLGVVFDVAAGAPLGPHAGEQFPVGWLAGREVGSAWLGVSAQPGARRAGFGTRAGLGVVRWTTLWNRRSEVVRTSNTVPAGLLSFDYTASVGSVFLRGSANVRLEVWSVGCPAGAFCEVPWPVMDLQGAGSLAFQVGTVR